MVDYKKEGSNLLKHLRKKGAIRKRWQFKSKSPRQNFFDMLNWAKKKGHVRNWRYST